MKTITLINGKIHNSKAVIQEVMETAPQPTPPLSIADTRARCRVLDALEALPDNAEKLELHDADYEVLKVADAAFPYRFANKELLAIREAIEKGE